MPPFRNDSRPGKVTSAPMDANPEFLFHIDYPMGWRLPPTRVVVRGWVVLRSGERITGIRAHAGPEVITGAYGLPRPDVANSLQLSGLGQDIGFRIEAGFETDHAHLSLLVEVEGRGWISFFETGLEIDRQNAFPDCLDYPHWIETHEPYLPPPKLIPGSNSPLISVLMPVFNTDPAWLRAAIESVRSQTWSHWQLCIADDASTRPETRLILREAMASDPRIEVLWRSSQGHIAAATNSALRLVRGTYCGFLDHDDLLAPTALACMVEQLQADSSLNLLYSDEDKLTSEGTRFDPFFKPDWNLGLFQSQNYLCHFVVVRTALLHWIGGFREHLSGSQDWDMLWRLVERIPPSTIRHVPRILYHWRAVAGSTALDQKEKEFALPAARQVLEDHLRRTNRQATVSPAPGYHWKVQPVLPNPPPPVTLIIPVRDRVALLRRFLESHWKTTDYPDVRFLVVDNGSEEPATEAYFSEIQERGIALLRAPGPFNFSALNNLAVGQVQTPYIAFCNNDLEVCTKNWLTDMVAQASQPQIGAVGARLLYPDGTLQHAGVILGLGGVAGHAFKHLPREFNGHQWRAWLLHDVSAVTAACLVCRREVFLRAGGFDEERFPVAFNDVDFCLRLRAMGYRILFCPTAELIHHESQSRGSESSGPEIRRFQSELLAMKQLWGDWLVADPAYNPNLTLDREDFSLAHPPRL